MYLLFETIKVKNRIFHNIDYHSARMNKSRSDLFGTNNQIDLKDVLSIPDNIDNSVYKCRIVYNNEIQSIEFEPYNYKKINKIKLVHIDKVNYKYKYTDREIFNNILKEAGADEVILCKDGFVTDTTFSNLCFLKANQWFTPSEPLLNGTKRQYLLDKGLIHESLIHYKELVNYEKIMLINAMLDFDEPLYFDIEQIVIS